MNVEYIDWVMRTHGSLRIIISFLSLLFLLLSFGGTAVYFDTKCIMGDKEKIFRRRALVASWVMAFILLLAAVLYPTKEMVILWLS